MTRLSNWKEESDLFEVVTGKMTDKEALKKVDEKKGIKNKVVINPKLTEAIKNMGGELISIKEQDEENGNGGPLDAKAEAEKEKEDQKKKQIENKQKRAQMIKKQVLMKKLIAVRAGSEDIVAHYEPDIEGVIEYFYEEGINEEGFDQILEEIGLEEFVDFVEGGVVELNEQRAARKMSVRNLQTLKKKTIPAAKAAEAQRKKEGKGEYSAAYKKKETDVTVYDDKPAKASVKKVKKAVAKTKAAKPAAKKAAPAKKAPEKKAPEKKAGLISKIGSAYKKGVERHKAARAKGKEPEKRVKEFGKGFASGVKDTVKFAGKVKKAVVGETLLALLDTLEEGAEIDKFDAVVAYLIDEQLVEDFDAANKVMATLKPELIDEVYEQQLQVLDEAERSLSDRLHRKRKLYDKTTKKAMRDAMETGEASGHNRFRMGSLDREMDGIKARMKKETKSESMQHRRNPEGSIKQRFKSKQTDPSKDNFTGIGDDIGEIMRQNAAMKKAAAKKKANK